MDKVVERKEPDGTWQVVKFENLKQGDCIRDNEYPDRTLLVETEPTYDQQAGCLGIKVSPYICTEQE